MYHSESVKTLMDCFERLDADGRPAPLGRKLARELFDMTKDRGTLPGQEVWPRPANFQGPGCRARPLGLSLARQPFQISPSSSAGSAGLSGSFAALSGGDCFRNTTPSGGSVSVSECVRPWSGTGTASTPPMFPWLLPP